MEGFNLIINKIIKGNSRSVKMKKNIIGSLLIKCISILVGFILVPMTLGYVNAELYGIWLTLSSIIYWLHFLDIGFTNGLKNKLAESIANNNFKRGKSLVSTTYGIMIVIFIPLCIILVFAIPYIPWSSFLNVNPIYSHDITNAMYVLVICFCTQMIFNVLTAVIAAYQQVALSSLFVVLGNCLSLIAVYFLTQFCPPSLLALSFAIAAMPIIVLFIASFYFFTGPFHNIAPSIKSYNTEYTKELFGLGVRFFLIQIQMLVLYQSSNILISNVSGPEDVTSYNLAHKYIGMAMMVYTILLQPIWPAFTDAYAKKDYEWMRSIYRKMCKVYALCACIVILMVTVSPIVYHFWIGDRAEIPFVMTSMVALYVLIHSWDSLQVHMINGIGTIKMQTYVTTIGLIAHIPLSLFLAQFIGALGVVLSMSLVVLLYSVIFTIQIRKLLNNTAIGVWKA